MQGDLVLIFSDATESPEITCKAVESPRGIRNAQLYLTHQQLLNNHQHLLTRPGL